ncbi:GGDEF domain-containing protein [Paraglaciecola arctica]|uniref:GGDEF domain-containing protein n=1 Tax=Paraglaciecola arctica TaxID=1128911 RepID=UPI002090E266|nr:GGDEF domain-containing protein [Paraglaciecola arctica]
MKNLTNSSNLELKHLQLLIVVAIIFMMSFMVADLALLPEVLHPVYFISRLGMQLPIMLIFLALTFTPFYHRIHHHVLWISVLGITYANYWVTVQSWLIAEFSFPYEGILLYALFATFILRLSFKYALIYVGFSLIGFTLMVTIYPVYGELTSVKLGFVLFGLAAVLIGVNRIEQTFKKLEVANSKLVILSEIDQLTGIYNRGTFETKFYDMLGFAKRTNTQIVTFMFDLDNFKDYNDAYGHLQGDKVIKLQAQILNEVFSREFDLVARYGGEEFVVACIHNSPQQCETLAQQVIEKWQQLQITHDAGNGAAFVCCSIGFYCSVASRYHTTKQILEKADKALYKAKESGRGRFVNGSD